MCGRIIATIGSSAGYVNSKAISISVRNENADVILAVKKGEFMDLSGSARNIMRGKEIYIDVDMGTGEEIEATAWGCDLSYDYVRINAGK